MILVMSATDGSGRTLKLERGPTVPEWGGPEAGLPGKAFAKVLRDLTSGESPAVSYWNQTLVESDNRIPAYATDVSEYEFAAGGTAETKVEARLIFRRLFHRLAQQKRWDSPDILLARVSAETSG